MRLTPRGAVVAGLACALAALPLFRAWMYLSSLALGWS